MRETLQSEAPLTAANSTMGYSKFLPKRDSGLVFKFNNAILASRLLEFNSQVNNTDFLALVRIQHVSHFNHGCVRSPQKLPPKWWNMCAAIDVFLRLLVLGCRSLLTNRHNRYSADWPDHASAKRKAGGGKSMKLRSLFLYDFHIQGCPKKRRLGCVKSPLAQWTVHAT